MPKSLLFFKQIELVFREKGNFGAKNDKFEEF